MVFKNKILVKQHYSILKVVKLNTKIKIIIFFLFVVQILKYSYKLVTVCSYKFKKFYYDGFLNFFPYF